MTVKAVNGKQGFVNLETQDIPESGDKLYLSLDERQEIIKLGNQTGETRTNLISVGTLIKELKEKLGVSTAHTQDGEIHFDDGMKKKIKEHIEKLHNRGRRGPRGERGFPGPPGGGGGGGGAVNHVDLIDMPSATVKDHDGRYYTETEIDTLLLNYLLLAGRAGGQIAIGGVDSGDNLTLKSTAHAIKGTIKADGETIRMKRLLAGGVT
ncbi:hypothetical protein KAR91_20795 [Candidatus Pacearchaeota archaeon]|nr:hypothetical protein [Candidatus Pacearchaeota archaeon]